MPDPREDKLESIIDDAMSNDDTDYGDGADTGDDQEGNEPSESSQEPAQQPEPAAPVPGRVPDTGQQPAQQQPAQQNRRIGAEFMDAKGNIVNKDGKVLAQTGSQARLWMEASRATALAGNLQRQLEGAQKQLQSNTELIAKAKEIAELPQKLGVSEEDYREGMTLMRDWKADPVRVAREVVARTLSFGHNLSDILGKNAGDAIEMKALTALINKTTAPIEAERVAREAETKAKTTAEQAYTEFVANHPFAEVHADAIANLMNKRGDSAELAYFKVKNFVLENGLDFEQPLGPQVEAMRSGQPQQVSTPPVNNGQRQTAPMLNGNGRGTDENLTSQREFARADDDWGSILKNVMGQTG